MCGSWEDPLAALCERSHEFLFTLKEHALAWLAEKLLSSIQLVREKMLLEYLGKMGEVWSF